MRFLDKKIMLPIGIVLLLILYFSYLTIKSPLVALGVKSEDGKWIVEEIYDNGWAYHQEINIGDILLKVDGKNPEANEQIKKHKLLRTAETLSFLDRNGEEKSFTVTYKDETGQLLSHLIFPLIYTLLTVYVAIYIYRKQKDDRSSFILILFLLCIALAYGSAGASSRGDVFVRLVNAITFAGCLILNIRFLTVFLKRFHITFMKRSNLRKLNGLVVLILIQSVITFFVPSFKSIQSLTELSVFSFLLILIIVLFIKNYSKYKGKPGNQAVKLLVVIFVLAFSPFTFLYAIPSILIGQYILNAEKVIIFLLIIPISFIYLQLAEKLFDVDYIMDRFKYYTVLAFPFASILCGIISLTLGKSISSIQIGLLFIALFISSIIFLYVKEWLDYKNRKYMFSIKGNLQTNLYTFFHKTRDEHKVQVVISRILQEMEISLKVKQAIFVDIQQQEMTKAWKINYTTSDVFLDSSELEQVKWEYKSIGKIISFQRGFGVVIGSDIGTKKIILCDEKKSGTNLNIEEKIWIEMMAYFASVVVENMKLIEGLVEQIDELKLQETNEYPTWLSKLLFSISEKERANLSNDLHDSILQEQLQLLREIDSIHKLVDDLVIRDRLSGMKEQMLDNVHLIRETCMELRPPLLNEQGLSESLHQLVRQTKLRCNFLLYVSLGEKIDLSKEQELIFYRIFQELLNNAMKHSHAKEVHIDFHQVNHLVVLQYKDDGVGLELGNDEDSFSSMGLVGIKERVRSIDGKLEIISSKGQGVQIRIEVGREGDLK